VATLLLIGGRPTPVLLEKHAQSLGCWAEIFFWVHWAQNLILRNAFIELRNKSLESVVATDSLIEVSGNVEFAAESFFANRLNALGVFKFVFV
jgi:hypothetical protein